MSDTANQGSYSFKKLMGFRMTDVQKAWYNENAGVLLNAHATEVWMDAIPSTPPVSTTVSIEVYDTLTLAEDVSVNGKMGWLCKSGLTQLNGFIPPRFGLGYFVRVFDANGAEILTADASVWTFDYDNGVLWFEKNPTLYSHVMPIKIRVYRYIGATLDEAGTTGASGIAGASGISGASGLSGTMGISGVSGASGTLGTVGASGVQGLSGLSGTMGLSGVTGASGIQGLSGAAGYSGADGLSGASGLSGIAGASGLSGSAWTPPLSNSGLYHERIVSEDDDCYAYVPDSNVNLGPYFLCVGNQGGALNSGMRWLNVNIPKDAVISTAYVTFMTADMMLVDIGTIIQADSAYIPATFTTYEDFAARVFGAESVSFLIPAVADGVLFNTPELKAIIQEIIDGVGWESGNPIALFLNDDGTSVYNQILLRDFSFTGESPLLHIEYSYPTPPEGRSGLQGLSGIQGFSGLQGLSGLSGTFGLSGLSGIQGLSGLSGTMGLSGLSGLSGSSGLSGTAGTSSLGGGTFVRKILASSDDCYISPPSTISLYNTRWGKNVLVSCSAGCRFNLIDIPKDAVVTTAYVRFTATSNQSGATCNVLIKTCDADNPTTFSTYEDWVARPQSVNSVNWDAVGSWVAESSYDSPEIKSLIQDIINRPGWALGNSLVLFFNDNASSSNTLRTPYDFGSSAAKCSELHIEWYVPVTPGASGIQGVSGIAGAYSSSGLSGLSGTSGIQGVSGLQGLSGVGVSGIAGTVAGLIAGAQYYLHSEPE